MCGLTGVLLYPTSRSPETWEEIKKIATANLLFNEERGREAAGIAVIQSDGRYQLFKQPVPASELVEMEDYRRVLDTVGDETVCILGHTRAPTKGSRWRNVNNHPLIAGHVIGIHNGVIYNDDLLFDQLQLPRAGEVDSEIIFRLQDTVNPLLHPDDYPEAVGEKINLLHGRFATLSVDTRKPQCLLVMKHLQPLCLHYEQEWESLFFSSRYLFLRKAFGRAVVTEALDSGRGYYFDAQQLPQHGNQPMHSFAINPQGTQSP